MRIVINGTDSHIPIKLLFPTGLVLNRFTAAFIPMALKDEDIPVTRTQAIRLIKELKRCKKRFPGWKLVEVQSAEGEHIEISVSWLGVSWWSAAKRRKIKNYERSEH